MAKKENVSRLKAMPVSIGNISRSKLNLILEIREKYIHFSNHFINNAFKPCFFAYDSFEKPKKTLENEIFQLQNQIPKGVLNKAYIEKARKAVSSMLWNRINAGKKDFLHKIHNIDKEKYYSKKDLVKFKKIDENPQKYQYFSNDLNVSSDDLDFIKSEYKKMGAKKRIQNTFEIIINNENLNFTPKQIEIIKSLYNTIVERYKMPILGDNEFFDITLDLDYRIVKDYKNTINELDKDVTLFIDKENKEYHFFLSISNPIPHEKPIKIPLAINLKAWRRNVKESASKSFSLVIKNNSIEVKHVIEKPDLSTSLQAKFDEIKEADYILGRDFGYKETISLSVVKNEFELSIEEFEKRLNLKKSETKQFYETHSHTPKIVERLQFSGKKFLNKIYIQSKKIDEISSQIALNYNEIEKLLTDIRNQLNIDDTILISKKMKSTNQQLNKKIDSFFNLLKNAKSSKLKRKRLYKKVAGIKRTWFGFLSNQELKLIKKYKAALVVEDLTVMAAEKNKPDYKGKRFNKMINNGSKGQYIRIAQEKMYWNGILEHRIPSYYSSTTCFKHSIVDSKMRKGERFKCKLCNEVENSDLHASSTISSFLMLKSTSAM